MVHPGNVLLHVVHPRFMQNNNLEVLLLIRVLENMPYVVSTLQEQMQVSTEKKGSNSTGLAKAV